MIDPIREHLEAEDDPELWRVVLDSVLSDSRATAGMMVEVGRCSHWLRPHQTRWTADGGFAWPVGYGGVGFSRTGLPLFDWSVVLERRGDEWIPASAKSVKPSLRIAIPSRTTRHAQAAVHTLWKFGRKESLRVYGFRKNAGE
ncbi:MAG TPA: hypothetical protein VGM03_23290 [Phycisphaerae bacterium]|jgi:hypothetical protein